VTTTEPVAAQGARKTWPTPPAWAAREVTLPRRRAGYTTAVTIGGEQFYLTANAAADGTLGEVFIQWGKHGSGTAGLMDLYASALSMALRHRVPLADLVRSGLGLRFAPAGRTDDPDIPRALSVADYVARRLAIDWLPRADRAGLGVLTRSERLRQAEPRLPALASHRQSNSVSQTALVKQR
jgi:ribonucleoside-diphosphate reductase alpha chain